MPCAKPGKSGTELQARSRFAPQSRVAGAVDFAHSAATDRVGDLVGTKARARCEPHEPGRYFIVAGSKSSKPHARRSTNENRPPPKGGGRFWLVSVYDQRYRLFNRPQVVALEGVAAATLMR